MNSVPVGRTARLVSGLGLALTLFGLACVVTLQPGRLPYSTVKIELINLTSYAVDPELYVTGGPITNPAELFSSDKKATGFGVGGGGFLSPAPARGLSLQSVQLEFDCSAVRYVGSKGGRFVDTSGKEVGRGGQRILVNRQVDSGGAFDCGSTIQLIYSSSAGSGGTPGYELDFCVDVGCR